MHLLSVLYVASVWCVRAFSRWRMLLLLLFIYSSQLVLLLWFSLYGSPLVVLLFGSNLVSGSHLNELVWHVHASVTSVSLVEALVVH